MGLGLGQKQFRFNSKQPGIELFIVDFVDNGSDLLNRNPHIVTIMEK